MLKSNILNRESNFDTGEDLKAVNAHSLECWTVSWASPTKGSARDLLISGGDDSDLCVHAVDDIEATIDREAYKLRLRNQKAHGAGVTAVLDISAMMDSDALVLLTGSYDEYIRVVVANVDQGSSRIVAEKRLGGGVWKLKLLERPSEAPKENGFHVLASCMHAGPKLLQLAPSRESDWEISVVAGFKGHESMNYASECRALVKEPGLKDLQFVSTSFYDKKLCVWSITDA